MTQVDWYLPDPEAGEAWAAALAAAMPETFVLITLSGDLGAGKTHTVRSVLRALGEQGTVRSPTYTLLESYRVGGRELIHMDLYRLAEAEELEHLGLRDFLARPVQMFIEWPERGAGVLPPADLQIELKIAEQGGRQARVQARSGQGDACLQRWQARYPITGVSAG